MEHRSRLAEKEKYHCQEGRQCKKYCHPHEDGGGLKGRARDRTKFIQSSPTSLSRFISLAEGPEPEPGGALRLHVANPLWGNKRHHADDGIADGKNGPEDSNPLGVANIGCGIHVGRLDVLNFGAHLDRLH